MNDISLKIPKGYSEAVMPRTEYTMD